MNTTEPKPPIGTHTHDLLVNEFHYGSLPKLYAMLVMLGTKYAFPGASILGAVVLGILAWIGWPSTPTPGIHQGICFLIAALGFVWVGALTFSLAINQAHTLPVTRLIPQAVGLSNIIHRVLAACMILICVALNFLLIRMDLSPNPSSSKHLLGFAQLLALFFPSFVISMAIMQLPWSQRHPRLSRFAYCSILWLGLIFAFIQIDLAIGLGFMVFAGLIVFLAASIPAPPVPASNTHPAVVQGIADAPTYPPELTRQAPDLIARKNAFTLPLEILAFILNQYAYVMPLVLWYMLNFQTNQPSDLFLSLSFSSLYLTLSFQQIFATRIQSQPWQCLLLLPIPPAKLAGDRLIWGILTSLVECAIWSAFIYLLLSRHPHWRNNFTFSIPAFSFLILTLLQLESMAINGNRTPGKTSGALWIATPLIGMLGTLGFLHLDEALKNFLLHDPGILAALSILLIILICIGQRLIWAYWGTFTPTLQGPIFNTLSAFKAFFKGIPDSRLQNPPSRRQS